jgi:cytochrome P450
MFSYPTIELKRLLYLMSKDPSKYVAHIEDYTSRTISRLSWGSPEHASELRVGTFGLLMTISPSGAVPNIVAPLAYLPAWLSPWQKRENSRHDREERFFHKCQSIVKAAVAKGTASPSYMKMFVEDTTEQEKGGIDEKEGGYVVGMMAIAGALTIGSPLQSYILAMCHYPWWQARVREEIEQVCGGRCPEWRDREQLPTLRAVMKEILRWRPPVPTGKLTLHLMLRSHGQ